MDPENPVSKISGPVVNSELLFFAATETTGGALTATLRELVKYPNIMDKLREELDEAFSTPEDITAEATANLPYLTGVIKEGLRLRSPVRIGAQYKTPKEGMYIDGTFIPGLVDVRVNPMALMAGKMDSPSRDKNRAL